MKLFIVLLNLFTIYQMNLLFLKKEDAKDFGKTCNIKRNRI